MTPSDLNDLNAHFGLPGVLEFEAHGELTRALITLPACAAIVYLHGAHLTHWQPAAQQPVLWLSELSDFAPGKPIRGGIPVCFPWFATDGKNRDGGKPGPSHGFARTQDWDLAFAALAGDALHLTLTLGPNDLSRRFGYDHFRVACEMIFGSTLTVRLTVANTGTEPLQFEEALHTYFNVGDSRNATVAGLESAPFLDKTDGFQRKTGPDGPLAITQWTDRIYPGNVAATSIDSPAFGRVIQIDKRHSASTVVWNPYPEGSAGVRDLTPEAWERFLCVETANAGADAITLAPGQAHTMEARFAIREPGKAIQPV